MSQDDKETPDHLHADQDDVGDTERPRHAEQQQGTGEAGADIEEDGGEAEPNDG